jgi:hypothetical protein
MGHCDLAKLALAVERDLRVNGFNEVAADTLASENPSPDRHRKSTVHGTSSILRRRPRAWEVCGEVLQRNGRISAF